MNPTDHPDRPYQHYATHDEERANLIDQSMPFGHLPSINSNPTYNLSHHPIPVTSSIFSVLYFASCTLDSKHSNTTTTRLIMAEEKRHHHGLFHHKKDEEQPVDNVYSETGNYSTDGVGSGYNRPETTDYSGSDRPGGYSDTTDKYGDRPGGFNETTAYSGDRPGGYSENTAYTDSDRPGGYKGTTDYPDSDRPGGYKDTTDYPDSERLAGYKDTDEERVDYEKEKKHHKHLEEVGGLGAVAAGAYALVSIYLPTSICFYLMNLVLFIKYICSIYILLTLMQHGSKIFTCHG